MRCWTITRCPTTKRLEVATLVDANVLLDLIENDPVWADWSTARLTVAGSAGALLIGDVVYAEIAPSFPRREDLDAFLRNARIDHTPMSREALFLAGKVHRDYRRSGGPRLSVLPDFFIGAQAATMSLPLLTRDVRRYRRYFPTITLIAPEA